MSDLVTAIAWIRAGRWDDAHHAVQDDDGRDAAWLHGILHLIEGDADNARHWYRLAGRPFPGLDAAQRELAALERSLLA